MSKISESLRAYAQTEKRAHEEYITDFTASTVATLVKGGVVREKANGLAKEACLRNEELVKAINHTLILEKVAGYIESLEEENVKLAASVGDEKTSPRKPELPEHLQKLSALGFTDDELAKLAEMPEELIQKVASSTSEPWEMGRGVGTPHQKTDPFLEFLLS